MLPFQEDITRIYLSTVENELQDAVKRVVASGNNELYEMLAYHMGWVDNQLISESRGKRIRPLLVLLTCSAAGGDWKAALPAAAAVELVHNFSLIHDDIEDKSDLRRGRVTVWKKWGIPQAINAGDAMFTLAHLHMTRLADQLAQHITLHALRILQQACLQLTQGQFLDLSYEQRSDVNLDDYWNMVEGKTAALISSCTELGALTADCDDKICESYRNFGRLLGLAFQAQDDLLGIWGDSALTGKSNQSDLLARKKTLPILYGLSKSKKFSNRWYQGNISPSELREIIDFLEIDGVKDYTLTKTESLISQALIELDNAHPTGVPGQMLRNLALNLVHRQV
jgi:geranylgeranyl diphosphate synthase type I